MGSILQDLSQMWPGGNSEHKVMGQLIGVEETKAKRVAKKPTFMLKFGA
jgi:hypothetical protein